MDFVKILEQFCNENNHQFVYGRNASLNLLDNRNKLEEGKIYFMLEPFYRESHISTTGAKKGIYSNVNFFICQNSNFDMPVYNEVGNDAVRSKYSIHIEPLIDICNSFISYITCLPKNEIINISWIDAYDIFDQNKDGIVVTMRHYNSE